MKGALPIPYMAINITFYNFSKKVNSTAQPSSGGTIFSCELIENTSIISPVIRLNLANVATFSPVGKSYAYIPDFQRYYFVTDWTYELGTWVAYLDCDVLASCKTSIGQASEYIIRSSYEFNRYIEDTMFPTLSHYAPSRYYGYSVSSGGRSSLFCEDADLGEWYIVGMIGGIHASMQTFFANLGYTVYNGSVMYYVLNALQMEEFIGQLLHDVNLFGVPSSEVSEQLTRQLINPMQYIESIKCIPFKPPVVADPADASSDARIQYYMMGFSPLEVPMIYGPSYDPNVDGWRLLKKPSITANIRDLPDTNGVNGWIKCHELKSVCKVHPQYSRGEWTMSSPYTRVVIETEPFGTIDVPSASLVMADKYQEPDDPNTYFNILFKTWFDVASGACRLDIGIICNQMFFPFYTNTVKVAIEVPCHQSIQDVAGFKKNLNSLNASEFNTAVDTVAGVLNVVTLGVLGGVGSNDQGVSAPTANQGQGVIGAVAGMVKSNRNLRKETIPNTALTLREQNAPKVSGIGSSEGSFISFAKDMNSPIVLAYYADLAPDNNSDVGRPLYAIRQISAIPGFIQCQSPHYSNGNYTASEISSVLQYMEGGFFYE